MTKDVRGANAAGRKVRYAVVGLGYIAQVAVLPAFRNARRNSELTALVSGDPIKRRALARRYGVPRTYSYKQYRQCLASGEIDAVYIALPNHMHRAYTVAAAGAGRHVLCEKPLAVTEEDCEDMIAAARKNRVFLMTAYRLHFEKANLEAIEVVQSGRLGETRIFNSNFCMQVANANIRLNPPRLGGGPLYDIGIYCINAARYLFRAEPIEVHAWSATSDKRRFRTAEETMTCSLRFPGDRLASFTCSFGAADTGWYQVVGTKGDLRVDPAYEFAQPLVHHLTRGGRSRATTFPKRDQFGPEILSFSDCILRGRQPAPSGTEGLADIRIIRALHASARTGKPVRLKKFERLKRPTRAQGLERPAVGPPRLLHAARPSSE